MSEIIESNDIVVVKKGRGRPKKDPKPESNEPKIKKPKGRPRVENPCKPGCPKGGREYFKAYYHSHCKGNIVNCPNCNMATEKVNLANHMRSQICAKVAMCISTQAIV